MEILQSMANQTAHIFIKRKHVTSSIWFNKTQMGDN